VARIDLYAVRLDDPFDPAPLSAAERARAARFVFDLHRRRFAAGRTALRRILARHLGVPAETVAFVDQAHGKPAVAGLEFNLSHSDELALVAISDGPPVGVDVERLRPVDGALTVAETFFAPSERAELLAAPPAERALAFLRGWTRKEAFIKALGEGMSHPLTRFEVSLGAAARLLAIDGSAAEAARWSLVALDPAPGYVGALAAPAPVETVWR